MKLLWGALPIEKALRETTLSKDARHKLSLINEVREYCKDKLSLKADKNYKDINLSWRHIIYNISASERLAFKPYTWWFPIIGNVPYKGFFEEKDADLELIRLEQLGLQTLKRRVGGYSTLGYFSDPLWPSMLELNDEALVELIIHELTHATFYLPYQTPFNETLANFVGRTGTRRFFVDKYGEQSAKIASLDRSFHDEKIQNEFFFNLYQELDGIYNSAASDEEKKTLQGASLKNAHLRYQQLPIDPSLKDMDWSRINNAYLIAFKIYNQDESVFADLFKRTQGDFGRFFNELSLHSEGADPFLAIKDFLKEQ